MKKLISIGVLMLLFVWGAAISAPAVADSSVSYATITGIHLRMGGQVKLGAFTVKFSDHSPDWDKVSIEISGPGGTVYDVVTEDGSVYYPKESDPYLIVRVVWISKSSEEILIELKSPIKTEVFENYELKKGESLTLPSDFPKIEIHLESIDTTNKKAKFRIVYPYGETEYLTIDVGETGSADYRLPGGFVYYRYLNIRVSSITSSTAKVTVTLPRVASTTFSVSGSSSSGSTNTGTSTNVVPVYQGLLYANEVLTMNVSGTIYRLSIVALVSTKISVKVGKDDKVLGTYTVNLGDSMAIPNTPIKISVQNIEPEYSRAKVVISAPEGTTVTPIVRPANIVASIDTVPKEVMVGQDMVIIVSVENNGRGDAYDVTVAAPVPDNFKLVSSVKSWTFKVFPAFTKMPALIYVLQPTKVGKYDIGKVVVTYYDDQSLQTGKPKSASSQPLSGIVVYGVPEISVNAIAYNGTSTSKYVSSDVGKPVAIRFQITASKGDPNYEFIKNATLLLSLPDGIVGNSEIPVGDIKAGDEKTAQAVVNVTTEGIFNVGAVLVYQDPLGNEHRLPIGNVVTINSIPPVIITKEVKVWPTPEELPGYINETLASMDNATPLAEQIFNISKAYLPPENKNNPWKPAAIVFLLVALVAGALAVNYWNEANRLKEKLMKKKQRRPGGLPKKEEETEEDISKSEEKKVL